MYSFKTNVTKSSCLAAIMLPSRFREPAVNVKGFYSAPAHRSRPAAWRIWHGARYGRLCATRLLAKLLMFFGPIGGMVAFNNGPRSPFSSRAPALVQGATGLPPTTSSESSSLSMSSIGAASSTCCFWCLCKLWMCVSVDDEDDSRRLLRFRRRCPPWKCVQCAMGQVRSNLSKTRYARDGHEHVDIGSGRHKSNPCPHEINTQIKLPN